MSLCKNYVNIIKKMNDLLVLKHTDIYWEFSHWIWNLSPKYSDTCSPFNKLYFEYWNPVFLNEDESSGF